MPCDPVITVADDRRLLRVLLGRRKLLRLLERRARCVWSERRSSRRHDERRLFMEPLQTLSGLAIVPGNAIYDRTTGFEVKTEAAPRIPRREDRFTRRLAARIHDHARSDGDARTYGHPVARGGLFGGGVSETTQAKKSPRAVRFELLRVGRRRSCSSLGAAYHFVRHRLRWYGRGADSHLGRSRDCWCWPAYCRSPNGSTSISLGTGLPSFWVAHMGEMQLTLGFPAGRRTTGRAARPSTACAPPRRSPKG